MIDIDLRMFRCSLNIVYGLQIPTDFVDYRPNYACHRSANNTSLFALKSQWGSILVVITTRS